MKKLIRKILKGQGNSQNSVELIKKTGVDSIENYKKQYLRKRELEDRCCAYISEGIHKKVSTITKLISDGNVTIGGYINNILEAHFETHKDEINHLCHKSFNDFKV